jgi:hypothetical protein
MTPLEDLIERLRQMPPERQEAFVRLLLREIRADEQWRQSTAQHAEWAQQRRANGVDRSGRATTETNRSGV